MIALLPLFEQHGVDVSFQVIDGDERLIQRKRQCLGVADANQQGTRQSRTLRDCQCIDGLIALSGVRQRLAHHGNDRTQMLPRG